MSYNKCFLLKFMIKLIIFKSNKSYFFDRDIPIKEITINILSPFQNIKIHDLEIEII